MTLTFFEICIFGCKKKRLTYELLYYKNKRKMNHRATF